MNAENYDPYKKYDFVTYILIMSILRVGTLLTYLKQDPASNNRPCKLRSIKLRQIIFVLSKANDKREAREILERCT